MAGFDQTGLCINGIERPVAELQGMLGSSTTLACHFCKHALQAFADFPALWQIAAKVDAFLPETVRQHLQTRGCAVALQQTAKQNTRILTYNDGTFFLLG